MTDPFADARPRLRAVAYGVLGSWADADDVVQDTWLAWQGIDHATVEHPAAYLTRAVTNRAYNRLRDAARRREVYIGPWLPEPVDTGRRPDEHTELADSLTFALLVLLERLAPRERVAFVLTDVFGVPAAEVADALDTTPANARQLASRARKALASERARFTVDPDEHARTADAFATALLGGEIDDVLALLAPDVELVTDAGGFAKAALRPVLGADHVARFLLGIVATTPAFSVTPAVVNGLAGAVITIAGAPTVLHIGVADGRVGAVWIIRNPRKLGDFMGS